MGAIGKYLQLTARPILRPLTVAGFVFLVFTPMHAFAEEVSNQSSACTDVLIVFARGSSDNPEHQFLGEPYGDDFKKLEKTAGEFFHRMSHTLDQNYPKVTYKAVSVHDFPDKYNQFGYAAVPIFRRSPPDLSNALNADFSWYPGDYRDSVSNGIGEITGYIEDQSTLCPEQKIIIGGYSQGAHVVGDSLFELSDTAKDKIGGVALFGDPKFLGAETDGFGPLARTVAEPWKRGTASLRDVGMLEPRNPYVPPGMEHKTVSWCYIDDFICSGYSGARGLLTNPSFDGLGAGHMRYASNGIPETAYEIIQWNSPRLYAINKSRGGVDNELGTSQEIPENPNTQPQDVMFVVDTSAGQNDVIQTLRSESDLVLKGIKNFKPVIRYGLLDYTETLQAGQNTPLINKRADLQPFANSLNSFPVSNTFWRDLCWGRLSSGGLDIKNPHTLALERALTQTAWDPQATKHIVLITDRPIKDPFTYNACNSTFRWHTKLLGSTPCLYDTSTDAQAAYSELCTTIFKAIVSAECSIDMNTSSLDYPITRTTQDIIKLAQARGVAVSVVVPHSASQWSGSADYVPQEEIEAGLKQLADGTGGLFIKYPGFNRANFTDSMWQISNHDPRPFKVTAHNPVDLAVNPEPESTQVIKAKENLPTTIDLSETAATFNNFEWDFDSDGITDEVTDAPSITRVFTAGNDGGFLSVLARGSNGASRAARFAVVVEPYEGEPYVEPVAPDAPQQIQALRNGDEVEVTWADPADGTLVMVGDPETGAPIKSAPAEQGQLILDWEQTLGDDVLVWTMGEGGFSERQLVTVQEPQSENPLDEDENSQEKNPALDESSPWSQYQEPEQEPATSVPAQASTTELPAPILVDEGEVEGVSTVAESNQPEQIETESPEQYTPSAVIDNKTLDYALTGLVAVVLLLAAIQIRKLSRGN